MAEEHDKEARQWDVVGTDNFARETEAEHYAVRSLTFDQAERVCAILRENASEHSPEWYVVRHESETLWGGMSEFV